MLSSSIRTAPIDTSVATCAPSSHLCCGNSLAKAPVGAALHGFASCLFCGIFLRPSCNSICDNFGLYHIAAASRSSPYLQGVFPGANALSFSASFGEGECALARGTRQRGSKRPLRRFWKHPSKAVSLRKFVVCACGRALFRWTRRGRTLQTKRWAVWMFGTMFYTSIHHAR